VNKYCKENGLEITQVAIRFSFEKAGPISHTILVGMKNREMLRSNIKGIQTSIYDKHFENILKIVKEKKMENATWLSGDKWNGDLESLGYKVIS